MGLLTKFTCRNASDVAPVIQGRVEPQPEATPVTLKPEATQVLDGTVVEPQPDATLVVKNDEKKATGENEKPDGGKCSVSNCTNRVTFVATKKGKGPHNRSYTLCDRCRARSARPKQPPAEAPTEARVKRAPAEALKFATVQVPSVTVTSPSTIAVALPLK